MTIQPLDALADAIAAIVEQNNALIATVSGLAAAYRGCAPMPPRPGRLSALLNCETNGAHIHLENFAHAAKAIPRGDIPHERLDDFLVSCGDLVETLIQVLTDAPDALGALYDVSREETRFTNFLKGVSGADVNLPPAAYALRIDLFIRDLKDAFAKLGRALVYFEYHLTRPRPESPPAATPAGRHSNPSPHSRQRRFTNRQEEAILAFVEQPEFDTGRERYGTTCYNVSQAARCWVQTKHGRGLPQTEEEFKRAYRTIRARHRAHFPQG